MTPKQTPSFESPRGQIVPPVKKEPEWIFETVPSRYGENVVAVIKRDGTASSDPKEHDQQDEVDPTIFQPLESSQIPEMKGGSKKRPSLSMTNRLVGMLKKFGVGVRDAVFRGVESDDEIARAIKQGQEVGTFKEKMTRQGLSGVLRGRMKTTTDVPVPVQATEERPIPNNLTQTSPGNTTKNNKPSLSSIEAAHLRVTNPADLINQRNTNPIDVAVDVAIKNDLNKLREASRAQRERKENQQERISNWKKRLGKVTATTKNKLETTLEKLGPAGNKLVSSLTKGSEYLKSQTSNKAVKIFAAAGLVSAGALAAYATPVVLASMAGVGLGLRVVSAAKVYAFSRKLLDEKYKIWEKEGTKKSTLSVAGYETAAIGFALFAGEAVGKAFEIIASSEVVHEVVTSIKNTTNLGSVTEAWGNLFNKETLTAVASDTQSVASTSTASSPSTTHEVAPPSQSSQLENTVTPPNPDLQHVVKKGDSLWSLLRKDLAGMNLEGFEELSQGAKERMMREILDNTSVPSGNIDKIYPGDTVDFNKVDFKAYLARYLDK